MNFYARFYILLLATLIIGIDPTTGQNNKLSDSLKLQSISNSYWKEFTKLNPLFGTQNGINDYNDQLEIPISKSYIKDAITFNKKYLDSLKTIDKLNLKEQDVLTADLLRYILERDLEGLRLGMYFGSSIERPVDQFVFSFPTRFATMASGAGEIPFRTVRDYENFLRRMQLFPTWVDAAIENMNTGIRKGNLSPRAAMIKVPAQLKPLFENSADSNIFYKR